MEAGFGGGGGGSAALTSLEDFCWLAFLPPPNTLCRIFGPPKPRDGGRSNLRSFRSGIADGGGGLAAPPSRPLPFPPLSVLEYSAVMSSDFFLRPAHARLSRLPALDAVLGVGERGGGLGAMGRA